MEAFELKKIRKQMKLTQCEFGDLIGVSRQTVASWESGALISRKNISVIKNVLAAREGQVVLQKQDSENNKSEATKNLMEKIHHLQRYNEYLRQFAQYKGKQRILFLRKLLSEILIKYCVAGYNTLELFRNAVLAVYPQIEISFQMVWDFQCFTYPEEASLLDFDEIEKLERALVVLTQKPGWV